MSNSSLVTYTKISPYKNSPRSKSIKKITIHHMAGNLSVERCGEVFQSSNSSANYGVDSNGNVGLYVDENDRSWASSSYENDSQAITIEVANDEYGGNWHVSDTALNKTIELCVDICKRNNIREIVYDGTPNGNLTRHNMFAATLCPGPYLQSKFPYIAEQINKQLSSRPVVPEVPQPEGNDAVYIVKPGDTLYGIARRYKLSYKALADYNGIANAALIQIGQEIRIPGKGNEVKPIPQPVKPSSEKYTIGRDNEETIFNFLKEIMKLNVAAATGILANIFYESGFNPTGNGDSGTSYGICQWHADRKRNLENWCASNGKDYTSLDGQLWFLQYELKTSYSSILSRIKRVANSTEGSYEAGIIWCEDFERPAGGRRTAEMRGTTARTLYWPKYDDSPKQSNFAEIELPILKMDDYGNVVKTLQVLLTAKNHKCSADGYFGADTLANLKAFQREIAHTPSGKCDQYTWNNLMK